MLLAGDNSADPTPDSTAGQGTTGAPEQERRPPRATIVPSVRRYVAVPRLWINVVKGHAFGSGSPRSCAGSPVAGARSKRGANDVVGPVAAAPRDPHRATHDNS